MINKTKVIIVGLVSLAASGAYLVNWNYHINRADTLQRELEENEISLLGLWRPHYNSGIGHEQRTPKSPQWIEEDKKRAEELSKDTELLKEQIEKHRRRAYTLF